MAGASEAGPRGPFRRTGVAVDSDRRHPGIPQRVVAAVGGGKGATMRALTRGRLSGTGRPAVGWLVTLCCMCPLRENRVSQR